MSLEDTSIADSKRIVVMDAGFYSKTNVKWLKENGFDYITVLPAGDSRFVAVRDNIVTIQTARNR